jgi:hypothetical protein
MSDRVADMKLHSARQRNAILRRQPAVVRVLVVLFVGCAVLGIGLLAPVLWAVVAEMGWRTSPEVSSPINNQARDAAVK